ncbi:MAG: hypothetical protein JW819_00055 [Candidatus Krumholzibacteriota bacterium]|nr:hypothetical protein [Candidatus Krumholzibacteriota bacterium]
MPADFVTGTVPFADLEAEVDEIKAAIKDRYEAEPGARLTEDTLKRGAGITCVYMKETVKPGTWPDRSDRPARRAHGRFLRLVAQVTRRVERKGLTGLWEKAVPHRIAKAFRDNLGGAVQSTVFLGFDVIGTVVDVIFAGAGAGWAKCVKVGKNLEMPVEIGLIFGGDTISLLADKGSGFTVQQGVRETGRTKYQAEGKRYETLITQRLATLDPAAAKATFQALSRVCRYYVPKVHVHFGQCLKAYEAFYEVAYRGREPARVDRRPRARRLELKTCDETVDCVQRVYRLYHEIHKLKQYLVPVVRFVNAASCQAGLWSDYWREKELWKLDEAEGLLRGFDHVAHDCCDGNRICFGPQKIFLDEHRAFRERPLPSATQQVRVNESRPHAPMPTATRTPMWRPTASKRERRGDDTFHGHQKKAQAERKKRLKAFQRLLKQDRDLQRRRKELKEATKKALLMEKDERIARFVDAGTEAAGAAGDAGQRFTRLLTDVGLLVEHRHWLAGKLRWLTRYLAPTSRTEVAVDVVALTVGIGGGVAVTVVTEGIGAGVGAMIIVAAWGVGKLVGGWILKLLTGKLEGAYDDWILQRGREWYGGKLSGRKRLRLIRNSEPSVKVASHLVSAAKNYRRLEYYRGADSLADRIKDCEDLTQYVWAVHKFQHHAVKVVEYNRPLLDFVLTVTRNLERWENRLANGAGRCLRACHDFVASEGASGEDCWHSHVASCGRFYKRKRFNFFRQARNTADLADRKSRSCYGPFSKTLAKYARRPLDLSLSFSTASRGAHRTKVRQALEELEADRIIRDEEN